MKVVAATGRGKPLRATNPRDGFGMKQGRADEGGTKRQEAGKAWRRRTAGGGNPGVGRCPHLRDVEGARNLMEGSLSRKRQVTLEFFDTLESSHNNGLVQCYGEAHERRLLVREVETRGEKSSEGQKAVRGPAGEFG
jgi:hypothetical protein